MTENTVVTPTTFPGLVRQLINMELLDQDTAVEVVEDAKENKVSIMTQVMKMRVASPSELAEAVSIEYAISRADLDAIQISPHALGVLSEDQKQRLNLLPLFKQGQKLLIGLADPALLPSLDDIKFATGLSPVPVIVEYNKLMGYLQAGNNIGEDGGGNVGMMISAEAITHNLALDVNELKAQGEDDVEIIGFVDKLLAHAIQSKVSDIHLEPYEKNMRIRYRVDGMLQVVATPPLKVAAQLVARLKVLSRMNISERRVPQDGRIRFTPEKNVNIDFRVNVLPTLYGEKVVMRILDSSNATIGVDKLGFESKQKKDFLEALKKPDGMILVTGPTGSGKTVTLYTGIGMLNTPDKNISTAEDPAEINMPGVNQVNINAKVGLTFADALRAFLRQDPDIIMLGEIRDLETAEISIKAAQTGHLVLSTLHTNSAPETLTRLMNMGVPAFNIASSVHLIIAQRLARRLCNNCKRPADLPKEVLTDFGFKEEELEELTIYQAHGCKSCSLGYKGRVGIYQVMPISTAMGRMLMKGCNAMDLATQAQEDGVLDLRQAGLNKVRAGITSLEELERVTKE